MGLPELLISGFNSAVAIGAGLALWFIKQTGETLTAGAKASAEEGAKTAIKNINWPVELGQELEKSRAVERQELRFKSYGELWKRLRPLAIYSDKPINRTELGHLNDELSDWYFSECGGMFLLPHAREFYFALQDFARVVSKGEDWQCPRSDDDHKKRFQNILDKMQLKGAAAAMEKLQNARVADWPEGIEDVGQRWREDIKNLASRWTELDEVDRFTVVQQVASVLRTNLANDVESRLR
jgi:hypothetical protein